MYNMVTSQWIFLACILIMYCTGKCVTDLVFYFYLLDNNTNVN